MHGTQQCQRNAQMDLKLRAYNVVYDLTKGFDHQLIRIMEEAKRKEIENGEKRKDEKLNTRQEKSEQNVKRMRTEVNQVE